MILNRMEIWLCTSMASPRVSIVWIGTIGWKLRDAPGMR
jgi:hypothetical protein